MSLLLSNRTEIAPVGGNLLIYTSHKSMYSYSSADFDRSESWTLWTSLSGAHKALGGEISIQTPKASLFHHNSTNGEVHTENDLI